MILIISNEDDDHAQRIGERLEAEGEPTLLLDLARFPTKLRLSIACSTEAPPSTDLVADAAGERIDLGRCDVAWWRRPQPLELDSEIGDPHHRAFAYAESHAAIQGLWPLLDALWINDPGRDEMASRKPFQLKVAREVGFEIPTTLIANDPERVREFVAEQGTETIYKAFSATQQAWRETRLLREDEMQLIEAVAFAPVIFQEYVPAALDLRVTMVGGEAFAAAIHSQDTPYAVDYRMHMDEAKMEPFSLPPDVEQRLRDFMTRLGLVYGAIDLRLTPDGRFVFLEVNPAGQWLFVEDRTGLPITETFAGLMLEASRSSERGAAQRSSRGSSASTSSAVPS